MDVARLLVGLGRTAPHHDEAVAVVLLLEAGDVVDQRHRLIPLVRDVLDPDALEAADPALVEHGLHRHDRPPSPWRWRRGRLPWSTPAVLAASIAFGEIGSQPPKTMSSSSASGTNSLDQRVAVLLLGAEADVGHLGERADRRVRAVAGGDHAGDEGGGHGAHAGREHTELAGGGSDVSSCHVDQ